MVEDVEAEAGRLSSASPGLAPLAVAGSKRLLDAAEREALERALDREAALCEQLFETADAREGLAAFLEKREPRFRGLTEASGSEPDRPVLGEGPERVVGDLPGVAVRVVEDPE